MLIIINRSLDVKGWSVIFYYSGMKNASKCLIEVGRSVAIIWYSRYVVEEKWITDHLAFKIRKL